MAFSNIIVEAVQINSSAICKASFLPAKLPFTGTFNPSSKTSRNWVTLMQKKKQ